ncbi:MAG: hypothetical protein DRQ01_03805, partial [Ignavibacteriae bacterium]
MSEKQLSGEVHYPSEQVIKHANAKCDKLYKFAEEDYEGFWAREAKNLKWFKKWS